MPDSPCTTCSIQRLTVAVLLASLLAGCRGLPPRDGYYQCEPGVPGVCPQGMTCTWSAEDGEFRCFANPTGSVCGNGLVEQGEDCDGDAFGGMTCQALGYEGGTLACTTGCNLDESGCTQPPGCGDGVLDPSEECDGDNLGLKQAHNI